MQEIPEEKKNTVLINSQCGKQSILTQKTEPKDIGALPSLLLNLSRHLNIKVY